MVICHINLEIFCESVTPFFPNATYLIQGSFCGDNLSDHCQWDHEHTRAGQGPSDADGPLGVGIHTVIGQFTIAIYTQTKYNLK